MAEKKYTEDELKIIQDNGEPKWENWLPMNESARLISRLRMTTNQVRRGVKTSEQVALESVIKTHDNLVSHIPDPDLKETDLIPYNDEEKRILKSYFDNVSKTFTEISKELNIPYHRVKQLIHSDSVKQLYNKVFKSLLPIEALLTIRAGLRKGDSKLAMEVLRDAGVMKSSEMNINVRDSQPLSDPKVIEQLKALGDSVSTEIINKEP